jgi:UDP-N-acetylmuramoyl-L-alanyl-D-glutamate--2,6-diaminopimelate ligase
LRLERILARLQAERLIAARAAPTSDVLEVRGITADSREVEPGTLFCAIRGSAGDGHAFLPDAAFSGAVAALVEEEVPGLQIPQIHVKSGRLAAAFAAAEFYRNPWANMVTVGVTGTNGKTTSVAILRHLLGSRLRAASIGTLGAVSAEGRVLPGSERLTTPGPVEIARWIRRLGEAGVEALAMEVSSHALDQARVAAIRFDAALFTNLSRDHLDYHGTLEAYRSAKLRLLELIGKDGVTALNADDPAWRGVKGPGRTIRFGLEADAEVRAESLEAGPNGIDWTLRTPEGAERVRFPLYGAFNVSNALGAAAALWGLGWEIGPIASALETLPQVPGRLERVPVPTGAPAVLIDFAHTPDALARALGALRPLVRGRLVVVFGAGGDRDRGKRPEMGRVAAEGADLTIVTSDNPRGEDPARIAEEIESGMGGAPRRRILDRREAIASAIDDSGPGDLVLLAGKGHETYQIWGSEKRRFDEREVVAEIFAGKGAKA